MPFALHGLPERALRKAELALFEINPAEAIEVRPVKRVFLQRLLDQRFRFVKPYPQVAQHVAIIIQHRSIFRIYGKHFLELLLGLVEKLLPLIDRAEQKPHHFVLARLPGQYFRGASRLLGFLVAPPALVHLRDVQIRLAVSRIAVELRSQNLDRLLRLSVLAEQQRVTCANRGIGRVFRQRFLARL